MHRLRSIGSWNVVALLAAWLSAIVLTASPAAARGPAFDIAERSAPPVRLLSPAPGAPLVGGTTVELAWEPTAALARLAHVEEWEAFLSLDGGLSYPLRLTPHLDVDVRRIAVPIPAVATPDARLLLRLGNERAETAVPLDVRLVIEAPSVFLPLAPAAAAAVALGPPSVGEPALPNAPGVIAWVEGTRRGKALRLRVASGYGALVPVADAPGAPALAATLPALDARLDLAPPSTSAAARAPPRRLAAPATTTAPRPGADVRLLTQRQNE